MIKNKSARTWRTELTVCLVALALATAGPSPVSAAAHPQTEEDGALVVSYAEAAAWLESLPAEDRTDQIRDYAVLGLAGILGLDLQELRNAFYDQTPVREPLFWDLAASHSGPGRSLAGDEYTLHILAPREDPYAARTIGLALDNYRKDTGADPQHVILYRYTIDAANRQVILEPQPPQPAADVRRANGYIEMSIATPADLEAFLRQTRHLSQLSLEDGQLRAGGWRWFGVPTGEVRLEDLAALQRGYLAARGDAVSLSEFLTTISPEDYGIDLEIPAGVKARAQEVEAFYADLSRANSDEDYIKLLTDHEAVVMDLILDQSTAGLLRTQRASLDEIEWFNQFAEEFVAAFEGNDLWGILWHVAEGGFHVPVPGATEPGFSLDPGPAMTVDELLAILPDALYPELAGRHEEAAAFVARYLATQEPGPFWDFMDEYEDFVVDVVLAGDSAKARDLLRTAETGASGDERVQAYETYADLVFAALSDQERPWPLLFSTATGKPPYQYARYDGGLQGTAAGMTYFYTDILAKGYFYELGQGNPYGIVRGFSPRSHAQVPWGHCTLEDDEGRIWFGLREEAVGLFPNQVNLGSVATRVFVLMRDPALGEHEIEPSYKFGQGIWWWDRHYMDMADYEPQYHRLDQLMRWGAAIAWLVEQDAALLPVSSVIPSDDWLFGDWTRANPQLTWQFDVPFVDAPGQTTETLLRLFSQPFEQCGSSWVASGGISNPSMGRVAEIAELRPELPKPVSRAGLSRVDTEYSVARASGVIASLDGIRRTLAPVEPQLAQIHVEAQGRKVWSLGEVKVAMPETATRRLSLALSQAGDEVHWRLDVQDVPLGELAVATDGETASVAWRQGPLADLKVALEKTQELLLEMPIAGALETVFSANRVQYDSARGEYLVQLGGEESREDAAQWLVVATAAPSNPDMLSFRLAVPPSEDDPGAGLTWYYASFAGASNESVASR